MRSADDVALDRLVAVGADTDHRAILSPVEGEASATAEETSGSLGHVTDPDVGVDPRLSSGERHALGSGVVRRATDQHLGDTEHLGSGLRGSVQDGVARKAGAAQAVLELRAGAQSGPDRVRNHDLRVGRALALREHPVESLLHIGADIERPEIGGRVSGAGVGRGERAGVEDFGSDAQFVSEEQLALRELRRDDLGVEEASHVKLDRIIDRLLVTVLQSGVGVLIEGAGATGVRAVWGAVLNVALEELALLQNEGWVLTGANRDVQHGHDGGADQTSLPVLRLLDDTGDVATENCS